MTFDEPATGSEASHVDLRRVRRSFGSRLLAGAASLEGLWKRMSLDQHDDDWQARLAQLESENAALRAQLESENAALRAQLESPLPAAPASATVSGYRARSRWWTALAATLIVIGCLLAPLAVIGGWGKTTLTDTDAFVATYAPLAHDPRCRTTHFRRHRRDQGAWRQATSERRA